MSSYRSHAVCATMRTLDREARSNFMAEPEPPSVGRAFPAQIAIDEAEITRRKAFVEFREEDVEALTSLNDIARDYAEPVIEDFYRHILAFEETRAFFRDPKRLERVKRLQKEYFLRLTQGNYDADY